MTPPRPLSELVEAGWARALEPAAAQIAAMGDFLRAIDSHPQAITSIVSPGHEGMSMTYKRR